MQKTDQTYVPFPHSLKGVAEYILPTHYLNKTFRIYDRTQHTKQKPTKCKSTFPLKCREKYSFDFLNKKCEITIIHRKN